MTEIVEHRNIRFLRFYLKLSKDKEHIELNPYTLWFPKRDMLPPLKSLILKLGLLVQCLYWTKYLQAIFACPAILLPGHGHIFLLSGYGQFMLSTSFLPLHGCWLLHYDLYPFHFHTHSDRLFRIISVLSLSFHIYSIFYWKERNGLPLPFSFLSMPVYSLTFPWTFHIHYPVRFFRNANVLSIMFHKFFNKFRWFLNNSLRAPQNSSADDYIPGIPQVLLFLPQYVRSYGIPIP